MNRRHATTPALLLAAGLALTGCSDTADDHKKAQTQDPAAAVIAVARSYQQAAIADDWRRACELSTTRLRRGTVEQCAARLTLTPSATPTAPTTSPSPSKSYEPPTYADGSTMDPFPTKPTPSGPETASTGPVTVEGVPVDVPASGQHPAGLGVLFSYTVTWPSETSTVRMALRVVKEAGVWRVDQSEDVQDGDAAHGDPIRDALLGR
ncbi:hypothetical protein ACFW6S_35370 [Streptomyces sp. NPDC058740]|uniref:hypothetical protein n=1 Tax=Streptomyces sp. NPDC058740 TaxID=3346619 RepID=UPI00367BC87C